MNATLSISDRIGDIVANHPQAARLFERLGIDYCCAGKRTLAEACERKGFDTANVTSQLTACLSEADDNSAHWIDRSMTDIADHIEQTHHAYLREVLPKLTASTEALLSEAGGTESLAALRDEVQRVAAELDAHIRHEEEALFPMVRDLASHTAVRATRCGDAVGGPIACMENEHTATQRSLGKLRELTGDYAAAPDASTLWRETMAELERFDRDMQEHIYKENEVLFPRALDAQRGQPQAAAG